VQPERDVGHSRTQRLAGDDGIVDRRRRWKNAGKERVQRAAIVGVIGACAGIRMRACVVTITVSAMSLGLVIDGLVVTGMRYGNAGSRMGLRERRRDDAGKLGDQKEGDQKPNRVRLCPEPLQTALAAQGSDSDSGPSGSERQSHVRFAVYRPKPVQTGRSLAPDGSCAERGRTPSLARISRLKTPRAGPSPGAG
jgi:hypothetical protein